MSLFRPEAIEAKHKKLYGDVRLDTPLPFSVLLGVLAAIAVGVIVLLAFGEYQRKFRVTGWLVHSGGVVDIGLPAVGVVTDLHAAVGDFVAEGAPLVTFDGRVASLGGSEVNTLLIHELDGAEALLSEQIALRRAAVTQEAEKLDGQVAGLDAEIENMSVELGMQREMIAFAQEKVAVYENLVADEAAAPMELLSEKERLETANRDAVRLERQIATLRTRRDAAERDRLISGTQAEASILRLEEQLSALRRQKIELTNKEARVITATKSGRVSRIDVKPGQFAAPGTPVVSLLPDDGELLAEMFVPASEAGLVAPGQQVRLRLDAFPYQRYGYVPGEVVALTDTPRTDEEVSVLLGSQEPTYVVTVRIAKDAMDIGTGRSVALKPGMTLSADVFIDRFKLHRFMRVPILEG